MLQNQTICGHAVVNLLPLYAIIGIGFVAGRLITARWEAIATLLIYVIAPIVVFFGIMSTPLDASKLSLPFLFFFICCAFCLIFLYSLKFFFRSPIKNILAFSAATGNTGYFGIPVAIFLFGNEAFGIAVLVALGFILYENTLGFFITARGQHTTLESLKRVLRLPTVYAFIVAVICNLSNVKLGPAFTELGTNFRGTYSVLGMMMIGLGVAQLTSFKPDFRFLFTALSLKFLVWPLVITGLILLDKYFIHFFSPIEHSVMLLMSIVPLPANSVALATELKTAPEKIATAVLISMFFPLFMIPLLTNFGI
jgi:malate permease and related proteins